MPGISRQIYNIVCLYKIANKEHAANSFHHSITFFVMYLQYRRAVALDVEYIYHASHYAIAALIVPTKGHTYNAWSL